MKKRKGEIRGGTDYYKRQGLEKSIILHLTKEVYDKLVSVAKYEDRSIQKEARRLLEEKLNEIKFQ